MKQIWRSFNDQDKDEVCGRLISRIVNNRSHCWENFLSFVPEICKELSDQQLISMFAFIANMFPFHNGVLLKMLIKKCKWMLDRKIEKKLLFSFISLFDNILAHSGSHVVDEIAEFADIFCTKIDEDNGDVVISIIMKMIKLRDTADSKASILRFISRLAPVLSDEQIEELILLIREFRSDDYVFLRLSAVQSLGDLLKRTQEPETLFEEILIKPILTERSDIVKCNSLRIIASYPEYAQTHAETILKLSIYKSWKIAYALMDSSLCLISIPTFKSYFLSQCKSQDSINRVYALNLLHKALKNHILTVEEVKPLVDASLQNKHKNVLIEALIVLEELLQMRPDLAEHFARFWDIGKCKSPAVVKLFLSVLGCRINIPLSHLSVVKGWIEKSMNDEEWRNVIDCFDFLIKCHDNRTNSVLIDEFRSEVTKFTSDHRVIISSTARICLDYIQN